MPSVKKTDWLQSRQGWVLTADRMILCKGWKGLTLQDQNLRERDESALVAEVLLAFVAALHRLLVAFIEM